MNSEDAEHLHSTISDEELEEERESDPDAQIMKDFPGICSWTGMDKQWTHDKSLCVQFLRRYIYFSVSVHT